MRVLIVAPSFGILGGQSVQAARLLERLSKEPSLEVGFCRSILACRLVFITFSELSMFVHSSRRSHTC